MVRKGSHGVKLVTFAAAAFLVGGLVGWCYEACIGLIERGYLDWEHGGLGIPFLQIYGVGGAVIELLFARSSSHMRQNKILCFIAICILTGLLEYGAGALMLYGMGIQTWDYRVPGWDFMCTPDGLLCLRGIITFGVLGMILLYPFDALFHALHSRNASLFTALVWLGVAFVVAALIIAYASGGAEAFK